MANTIKLRGDYVLEEADAASAVSPGNLCEFDSSGDVQVHSTSGGACLPMWALEDSLQGKTIDDAYTTANRVQLGIFRSGDLVNALIADGEDIDIGDKLVSDGAGALREMTSADEEGALRAIAMEAKDMTGSAVVAADHAKVMVV